MTIQNAPAHCLRRLNVSMYNPMFVHCGKSFEQRPKVYLDFMMVHRVIEGLCRISYQIAQGPWSEVLGNLDDGNVAAQLRPGPDVCKR